MTVLSYKVLGFSGLRICDLQVQFYSPVILSSKGSVFLMFYTYRYAIMHPQL